MFTPIEIQNHSLKTSVRGYSKKETDDFLEEILKSYEELYKENRDLKDKVNSLSEGIQYYKNMESTLQKALVLAEKTSSETQEAAKTRADSLMSETETKVAAMQKKAEAEIAALRKETEAYSEVTRTKVNQELAEAKEYVRKLIRSYENYRLQFKRLAQSQIEMLDSEHFKIFEPELAEVFPKDQNTAVSPAPEENTGSKENAASVTTGNVEISENTRTANNVITEHNIPEKSPDHTENTAPGENLDTAGNTEPFGNNNEDHKEKVIESGNDHALEKNMANIAKILGEPPLVLGNEPIPDTVPLPVEELRAIMASIPQIPDITMDAVKAVDPQPVSSQQTPPEPQIPVQQQAPAQPQVTQQQPSVQQTVIPQQPPVQQQVAQQQPPVQQQVAQQQPSVQQTVAPQQQPPIQQPVARQQSPVQQQVAQQQPPMQQPVTQQPVQQTVAPQQAPIQQQVAPQQAVPKTAQIPGGRQLTADDMPPIPSADDMPPILSAASPQQTAVQDSPFTFIDPE